MDWGSHLEKILSEKRKNSKNQSEIAAGEQKISRESEFLFGHRFRTLL